MIVGLIADGNRRWAKKNSLPASDGHRTGFKKISDIILPSCRENSECTGLVIYGFSTENWKRDPFEIKNLMQIYSEMCDRWEKEFKGENVRLRWCGRRDRLPSFLTKKLRTIEEKTKNNTEFTVYICLDYGSHDEIQRAVEKGGVNFEKFLEVPPLDIIIRSGGEQRLSNFCLHQAAYAELYFEKKFLPEFEKQDIEGILKNFLEREKRKGGD